MSVKQNLAEKAISYNKFMSSVNEGSAGPVALSMAFSAIMAPLAIATVDFAKPLESDTMLGQEAALKQYDKALTTLMQKRDKLNTEEVQAQIVPEGLKKLIFSKHVKDLPAKTDAKAIKEDYKLAMKSFITSAHVDKRLSEQNVSDIFTRFSKNHGAIDTVTDFEIPDYNDLQECRIKIGTDYAYDLNKCTQGRNEAISVFQAGIGFAILPWLLVGGISTQNKRLRRWASEQPPKNH